MMANDEIKQYLDENLAEVPIGFRWEVRADASKGRDNGNLVSLILSRNTLGSWHMYVLKGGKAAATSFTFEWETCSEEDVLDRLVELSYELISTVDFNEYQTGFRQAIQGSYRETL